MKKNRDFITATLKFTKIAVLLILLAVILVTISSCAAPQTTLSTDSKSAGQIVNNQPVQMTQKGNSSKDEQYTLKIIIYTDFECGACERFNLKIEPKLREYEAAGIAQIVIRLLGVLSDDSLRAAQAALWAGDQGDFLEYHDALFGRFRQDNNNPYSKEKLIELAGSLGLNEETLRLCLDTGSKKPELAGNKSMAKSDGVDTLPTVFINGTKIEGFKPLTEYIQVIDHMLKETSH
jgi:protein-disulfide isomerase